MVAEDEFTVKLLLAVSLVSQHQTPLWAALILQEFLNIISMLSYAHVYGQAWCLFAVIQHSHFVGFPGRTHTKYVQ